ncbi:helix-turn-helix domain-containing protein [Peptoniphilus equinus]|uniref:Helix-turn-helix domain-containing protein n=1 Tax=Peptoniphilus equinus TaxID=3016343 RepID=A0ABY7QSG7_9FIRM|nr:helix-turn-helix domain-containing protein [Peptoniphilus equinus]WBW49729.1 helix-turn-helix domain-containing protein [Peptoniphilus equinus]
MELGSKIKNLRVAQDLTQEELADRSDLTKGFISQLERDLTSPSVATLVDILAALGTTPAAFFQEEKDEAIVFTSGDQVESVKEDYTISWPVPNAQKNQMEPVVLQLQKGAQTKTEPPFAGEVFGYVEKGKVHLHYGEQTQALKSGDSFYFRAKEAFYLSTKKSEARVLMVSSPPHF